MRPYPLLLASNALLAAAACSSTLDVTPSPTTTSTSGTTTGGGTSTGSGGTATGSGGTGGTGTAGTGTGGLPTVGPDAGPLTLQAFSGPAGRVTAQVPMNEPGVGQEHTCAAPMTSGACQLVSCVLGGIGDPAPGYGNYGPLSASVGTTTVAVPYTGFGYPTVDFPMSVTLGTGGVMTFHGGNGADVPLFDIPITIPGLGVITSPVPATDGGAALIDTSQDLTVTWLPIALGQINFGLSGGSTSIGGTEVVLTCTFEGSAGSAVVPRPLLSSLKAISGTNPAYGFLGSEIDTTTVVGWLTIVTQGFQLPPTGGAGFAVTLE